MNKEITDEKLDKYFSITMEALAKASSAPKKMGVEKQASDVLDMASRYFSDAKHFRDKEDYVLAFGALNYAHGWLDAGARLGLFIVKDSRLFTVDDE